MMYVIKWYWSWTNQTIYKISIRCMGIFIVTAPHLCGSLTINYECRCHVGTKINVQDTCLSSASTLEITLLSCLPEYFDMASKASVAVSLVIPEKVDIYQKYYNTTISWTTDARGSWHHYDVWQIVIGIDLSFGLDAGSAYCHRDVERREVLFCHVAFALLTLVSLDWSVMHVQVKKK